MIFIVAFVVVFHFDSEISKKVVDVRVCDSQQKDLQNKVEGCMADLSEMHGEVYQLNLVKTAASGTIACLENEVHDLKEKLNEMQNECDLAREKKKENEECRKMINDQRQTIQELRIKLQATERLSQNEESKLPVSVNPWLLITAICTVILVWCLKNRCKIRNKQ